MDPGNQDHGYGGPGGAFGEPATGPGTGRGPEGLQVCPWEERDRYGFLNALYLTTREVLTAPGPFFGRMPSRLGYLQPLFYAIVLGMLAALLGWIWSLTGSSLRTLASGDVLHGLFGPVPSFLGFIASPFTTTLDVAVRAGLMHLLLMLLGGNKLGFEATFRVAAYGKAAGVVALVPFCGSLVAVLWELAIDIIGLYRIHGTDPWRALVAVLAPAVLCFSSIAAAVLLVILGAAAS
jgi:hypothetical protein